MTFTLTIELGNDAMQTGRDVAEALHTVADKVAKLGSRHPEEDYGNRVGDLNGNKVGEWGFTE